jgi:hypothetical protein
MTPHTKFQIGSYQRSRVFLRSGGDHRVGLSLWLSPTATPAGGLCSSTPGSNCPEPFLCHLRPQIRTRIDQRADHINAENRADSACGQLLALKPVARA